ncbi:Response regulator receiver domain-containing protein [Maridesulfovibrio ferrireducens]|uniref:Response regulator receiver domain-containing protein n=1 Tax=Maridesulfovibrio ferrireducens TaxID=246191 RepID=A0A1G9L862_9BACT|nr:response regulator [Maridesulfovibrio ferrireducens]SDL58141.1 Response regulator receiver domain-containing protein [Maridesulfovibrio ferrireducens]
MEQMKIMLVDDEERLLSTTKKLFEKMGIDVFTSTSGKDALELLRTEDVHVIFLDIKMPGMDGMETLQRIKKDYPLIEVIILTGHATMESAVEGLKLGAMDFLVKPVSMKDILGKVEEAFEKVSRHKKKILSARMADVVEGRK